MGEDAATGTVAALEDGDLESLGEDLAGGNKAREASIDDDDSGREKGGGAAWGSGEDGIGLNLLLCEGVNGEADRDGDEGLNVELVGVQGRVDSGSFILILAI